MINRILLAYASQLDQTGFHQLSDEMIQKSIQNSPSPGNSKVYAIPLDRTEEFITILRKINSKGQRILGESFIPISAQFYRKKAFIDNDKREYKFDEIIVYGPDIVIDGWRLIAKVTHTDEENRVTPIGFRRIPREMASIFRYKSQVCEHCGVERGRNATYILYNEQGEKGKYIQVGRNCLRNFLGENSPHNLLKIADFYGSIDRILLPYENIIEEEEDGA